MVVVDGPNTIRRAIQFTRGNSKATDQQITDLIMSCRAYRDTDAAVKLFCNLMEIDEASSAFPFVLYARNKLMEISSNVVLNNEEQQPCVTCVPTHDPPVQKLNPRCTRPDLPN
jgi:hypothetical protein